MRNIPSPRSERPALSALALTLVPGTSRGAASIEVAGAYFPTWLGCCLVAIVVAILARVAMAAIGLAEELPLQLFVCLSIGVFVAALAWIAWIGS